MTMREHLIIDNMKFISLHADETHMADKRIYSDEEYSNQFCTKA